MKKYENFSRALANLTEGVKLKPPYSPVEHAGIIGLFELCYELSWKLMKELLEKHGRMTDKLASPRAIIKLAYQHGMIADESGWLDMLELRNTLIHIYDPEESLAAIKDIKQNALSRLQELKQEIDRRWL